MPIGPKTTETWGLNTTIVLVNFNYIAVVSYPDLTNFQCFSFETIMYLSCE